jgi:quinol monooxygenase YgiN
MRTKITLNPKNEIMKKEVHVLRNLPVVLILVVIFSFGFNLNNSSKKKKIENTLQSVSLFQVNGEVDPIQLYKDFESVNKAIEKIGYPDAGYVLWEVKSDDDVDFRFMVVGHWPDQETYTLIHEHPLYKKATDQVKEGGFKSLKSTWYHRFNKIKD